jgi:dihydrofolate synthase / folylpolyglutamate synthase
MPSAGENTRWVAALSPWPEEFGLGRMRELLRELGDPQQAFPAIHVVGTNGKTTTTRICSALLAAEGQTVGAYTSPHVTGWEERIQVNGEPVDLESALARIRGPAEALGATQFEALTAAALAEFAAAHVDVAVVEAGLGGRHDATNVLRAPVVVLTNVGLDHTEILGETREAIAAEKLAVVAKGSTVILGEAEWSEAAREAGAGAVVVAGGANVGMAVAAAESFLGRPVEPIAARELTVPGRLEQRGEAPLEIWDGAHNLAGVGYSLARLPARSYVVVASMLADKDVDGMLAALSALGDVLVATQSTNPRALAAADLAERGRSFFDRVEVVDDPARALELAREIAGESGAVLVTGSLYLLADLASVRPQAYVP